jgi:hypothetical protein
MLAKLNTFSKQLLEKIANRTHTDGMACVQESLTDLSELAMAVSKAGPASTHVKKVCETIVSSTGPTRSAMAPEAQRLNKDLVGVLSAPCRRAWVRITTILEKKKAAASSSDVKRLEIACCNAVMFAFLSPKKEFHTCDRENKREERNK